MNYTVRLESLFDFAVYNPFCLSDFVSPGEDTAITFTVYFETFDAFDNRDSLYDGIRVFSSRDLHVHTFQFCHAVSAVISTRDFLETSVGGDNVDAISIRDFVGTPVCADNTQVASIRDFHRVNSSVATDRDIAGFPVCKPREMQSTPPDLFLVCAEGHSSRDFFHHDLVFSSDYADSSVSGDFTLDALTDACSSTYELVHCAPTYFVFLHEEVAATGLPNYRCRRIPIITHLNLDTWDDLLTFYQDNMACEYLRYGWPVNYDYVTYGFPQTDTRTHRGALNYPAAVSEYIRDELSVGAISGPFSEVPFSSGRMVLSPLNSVPKGDGPERRIILDLSWPPGSSVNSGISCNEYDGQLFHLCYPTVDNIAELIVKHGVGCLLFKRDLRRAYRQFPVDPLDYPLLGYLWEDMMYFDTALPMGLRSSAMACQRITSGVCYICTQSGYDILNYLDDFMGVAPPSQAWTAYHFLGELLSQLGLRESTTKAVAPSTVVTCLGVQFDTVNMTMSVAPFRLAEIFTLLKRWRLRKSCTKSALQSLLGKLMFVAKCVRQSRVFVSRILDLLRSIKSPTHHVRLTSEFRKDICWWQAFLPRYNGISLIPTTPWSVPDAVFATDACLTGCGGVSSTEFFHSVFPDFVLTVCTAIHHLELLVVMVAVRLWGQHWRGRRIQLFCDNEAVVSVINSGRTRDAVLATCLREIWLQSAQGEFELRAVHLTSQANRTADYLSRWHLSDHYRLALQHDRSIVHLTRVHLPDSIFKFDDTL